MKDRKDTGKRGEDAACLFLESKGHRIVARNWRASHKEIDIVSVYADEIHIVEVKTRTAPAQVRPEHNVDLRKQRLLASAAKAFLHSPSARFAALPAGAEIFFDVVSVLFEGESAHVQYFPAAYIPLYV